MSNALTTISLPGVIHLKSGKVREIFDVGDYYLLVATDRISAFDCVMPNGIPLKGQILNTLSAWWFEHLSSVTPNHIVETDDSHYPDSLKPYQEILRGRSMLVKKSTVIPVECVARGYLIGSGWKEYQATGTVCGIPLRPGYRLADKLDEAIFTPSSKADTGHDENITFDEVVHRVGAEVASHLRGVTLELYRRASEHAAACGIILADTKFEFGIESSGKIILIDEALTPDSSRYWPADQYRPGTNPPSFDKQYVRDYLESLNWNKQPPAPRLPEDVVARTRDLYLEAFRRLTGRPLPTTAMPA